MSLHLHPLDLPELAAAISLYLPRKALTACLYVCRGWHAAFLPFVWSTVDRTPTAVVLQRHAHLVHTIICENELSPALSRITLPNLRALNITRRGYRYQNQHQPSPMLSFTLFLQNNPTITTLFFHDALNSHAPQFWRAVADLPHPLRLLKVSFAFTRVESCVDFITACSHAEELDLKYSTISNSALSVDDISRIGSLRFHSLKTLNLSGFRLDERDHLYTILSHCPALERLTLNYQEPCSTRPPIDRLVAFARTRPWPLLKHLWVSMLLTKEQSQDVLEAFTYNPLVSLGMHDSITPQAFSSLMHTQFPTITHLSVMGERPATTREMNQRILTLCPLLISFKGGIISGTDIIDGPFAGPWACLHLEELRLTFDLHPRHNPARLQVPPVSSAGSSVAESAENTRLQLRRQKQQEDRRLHQGVFEQLARLTSLRVLEVGATGVTVPRGLTFGLEYGLAILEPLGRLRSVVLSKACQPINKKDLEWMAQHWKHLKRLEAVGIAPGTSAKKTDYIEFLRR